jgi:hypothetical protein
MNKYEQTLRIIAGVVAEHYSDDDTSDGELLDIVFEVLDEVGLTVGGEDVPTNFMRDLRRDAARWNAFTNTPIRSGSAYAKMALPIRKIACALCVHVGNDWDIMIDHRTAAVVPWDVMGDARSFAFVCDECASGSAVVL